MKTTSLITALLALILFTAVGASAQDFGPGSGNGECQFIDEDGDGFNDLAPDADGDGIPNGLDPDYVKPEDGSGAALGDGTGNQFKWAHAYGKLFRKMFGEDTALAGSGEGQGHYGPGDGSGECIGDGVGGGAFGPGSGTGTGAGTPAEDGSGVQERRGGRR